MSKVCIRLRSVRLLALPILALGPFAPAAAQVDHPCIPDPTFPPDCVAQLGAIGSNPVTPANEGFLNISSPVVNPLLLLQSDNAASGLLYVLNPMNNRVRIINPGTMSTVRNIRVCYRPSSLAQSADGGELYVSCHASDAVAVVDTAANRLVDIIQDRDADGRPVLQEPMGMAVAGDLLYVASSQNNRIAVINLNTRRVLRSIPIPGQDPRNLALSPDGRFLVASNFMAGNRTEPSLPFNAQIFNPGTPAGSVCAPILNNDPTAINVIDETHPDFMDTSHPDYAVLAECYFFAHTFGASQSVVINPARTDHDLVVIDLLTDSPVFTTDVLPQDIGTLNNGIAFSPSGEQLYLVTVHARNDLDADFGNRPLLNRLVVLDVDGHTGALSLGSIVDLDDPFLDDQGEGAAVAATPYAVTLSGGRVLIAAAGSDNLVVADLAGNVQRAIPVGFTPKGVAASGDVAFVYNATGLEVSKVDLDSGTESATASIGNNGLSQKERIGAHLFNSAQFASNKTFACASCHPDGHLDGLLWMLNEQDGLRSTMTLQEITETAPYHWDGAKCNLVKILQDGIVNLFGDPDGPSECEMETMIEFMDGLVKPHSPFRALDDSMSDEAEMGLAIMNRGRFKDLMASQTQCNGRPPDPAVEGKFLAAIGDPQNTLFNFNGGGGPVPNTLVNETCSTSNCHATPHWNSLGTVAGIEAVSTHGLWDRMVTTHDAFTTRARFIEALDTNRTFHGAQEVNPGDNYTGKLAGHAFTDSFFRHPEYNFDGDSGSHGFPLAESLTRFMMEEEQLQASTVGVSVVVKAGDPDRESLQAALEAAANQGKIALLGEGTLGGTPESLVWNRATSQFEDTDGGNLSMADLTAAILPDDTMTLFGVLPPGQSASPNPKVLSVSRPDPPILCAESPSDYHASVETGEAGASLVLHGIDVVAGSQVLIDGRSTGAPLAGGGPDFLWSLPVAPALPTILTLQVLSPSGMQSNAVALPVVAPVVPALEPDDLEADGGAVLQLSWLDQFGITGPGTRYDVFGGTLSDLLLTGFSSGSCLAEGLLAAQFADLIPPPRGEALYYLARAQNQVNVTSWGNGLRDLQIEASTDPCDVLFP